jgi:hypothetical protein
MRLPEMVGLHWVRLGWPGRPCAKGWSEAGTDRRKIVLRLREISPDSAAEPPAGPVIRQRKITHSVSADPSGRACRNYSSSRTSAAAQGACKCLYQKGTVSFGSLRAFCKMGNIVVLRPISATGPFRGPLGRHQSEPVQAFA